MKKTILVCLLGGTLSAPLLLYPSSYKTGEIETNTMMQQTNRIDLEGKFKSKGGFRSGTDPIVAELQGTLLLVHFQKDVGTLHVAVTGQQGQVYTTAVNTQTPSELAIPLTGISTGNYTVTFSGESGMMWGEFIL